MSSLTLRRLAVFIVSLALGFLVTGAFIVLVLPWMGPQNGFPISFEKYGTQYFLWTALPIAGIFLVWLDYFLDTRILPD
jgi:ribose/xylose/arabinose/galactoside ABC-type transport system permease subunit